MKKKGFTLIELLAVIVILAIIALIAVPTVIKIINNAKKDAAKSSVLGYVDAIEYSYVSSLSSGEWDNIEKDLDGCYNVEQLSNIVMVDGVMPSSDTKVCIDENSIVSYMEGSINNYNFKYENEKVIIEGEIIKTDGSIDAPTAKVLVYNGEEQELINEGSSTTGEVQYKLEGGSYSTTIPTGVNAGSYKVYYKVIGDSNHLDVAEASVNVTINKATGSVTAPTAKELLYNGEAQELINAGSSTTGEVQYKLEGGSYSTSIPTATDEGTYTVYYRVVGNSNYNDVAEASIKVTVWAFSQSGGSGSSSGGS